MPVQNLAFRAWLLGCFAACCGCGVALHAGRPPESARDLLTVSERAATRCIHGAPGRDGPFREPLPDAVTDPELDRLLARFSPDIRRTAVAAGLEPLLARVLQERERERASGVPSAHLLALRQELSDRMLSLETQLLAMEFEDDCVRGLLNDALGAYAEGETDRQLALTIASLVVGAVTSLAAGVWDLANAQVPMPDAPDGPLVVAIAGAVGTTALGAAVLVPEQHPIVFVHEHNLLEPIVLGSDPDRLFPTFLFRLLTLPLPSGGPTPREELLVRFEELVDEAVAPSERALARTILFGDGGIHDPRLLTLHQALLQELGATLDALARDVDLFSHAVLRELEQEFDRADAPPAQQSE